ncbi:MAG: CSLREA domain-containing protein [Microcoleus sp.]
MATFTVNTSNDVVNPNDGVLSLREAIAAARNSSGRDKILVNTNVNVNSELKIERGNDIDFVGNNTLPIVNGQNRTLIHPLIFRDRSIAGGDRAGLSPAIV